MWSSIWISRTDLSQLKQPAVVERSKGSMQAADSWSFISKILSISNFHIFIFSLLLFHGLLNDDSSRVFFKQQAAEAILPPSTSHLLLCLSLLAAAAAGFVRLTASRAGVTCTVLTVPTPVPAAKYAMLCVTISNIDIIDIHSNENKRMGTDDSFIIFTVIRVDEEHIKWQHSCYTSV